MLTSRNRSENSLRARRPLLSCHTPGYEDFGQHPLLWPCPSWGWKHYLSAMSTWQSTDIKAYSGFYTVGSYTIWKRLYLLGISPCILDYYSHRLCF
jgi:hypothetical protein